MTEPARKRAMLRPVEKKQPEPSYDRGVARERVRMLTLREAGITWRDSDEYMRARNGWRVPADA